MNDPEKSKRSKPASSEHYHKFEDVHKNQNLEPNNAYYSAPGSDYGSRKGSFRSDGNTSFIGQLLHPEVDFNGTYVWLNTLMGSLGFGFWGYCLSIFNSVFAFQKEYIFYDVPQNWLPLIASILMLGGAIGGLLGGFMTQKYGRRKVLLWWDFAAVLGTILTCIPNFPATIIGRFLQGLMIGVNTTVAPLYVLESSPIKVRGIAGTINMFMLTITGTIAFSLGYVVPTSIPEGTTDYTWLYCYAAAAILPIIRIIGFICYFHHDTAYYSVQIDNLEQAKKVLHHIYNGDVGHPLMDLIRDRDVSARKDNHKVTFTDLFSKSYRRVFFMGALIAFSYQFDGLNAIFVFINQIMSVGVKEGSTLPNTLSVLLSILNNFMTFFAIKLNDSYGRKPLLIKGFIGMGVLWTSYAALGYFDSPANIYGKIILVLFPIFFSFSGGGVTFLYMGETLPDIGMAACSTLTWVFGFIVTQFYVSLANKISFMGTSMIFGIWCFVAAFLFSLYLIESKDKTKAEITLEYEALGTNEEVPNTPDKLKQPIITKKPINTKSKFANSMTGTDNELSPVREIESPKGESTPVRKKKKENKFRDPDNFQL